MTLPRATWHRNPHRDEEITKRPQEERERYIRAHAMSTPVLMGMQDIGKQTQTNLSPTVQGSNSLMASIKLKKDPVTLRDWGGNVTTESVNTRALRKKWGTGFGAQMVDGSLDWFRHVDEHKKRYLLESTRERMTRDAMNAFENQQGGDFRDE